LILGVSPFVFLFLVTINEKILLLCEGQIEAFIFDGYWVDMRSIEAFYQANMESTKKPVSNFNTGKGRKYNASASL
jgi:ADP-glucose pyrophosphorylase